MRQAVVKSDRPHNDVQDVPAYGLPLPAGCSSDSGGLRPRAI